jgi:UPF0755 protein
MSDALKRNKRSFRIILFVILLLLLIGILFYTRPEKEMLLSVRPGDTFHSVAGELREQGSIRSTLVFIGLAKLTGKTGQLKAGTYRLNSRFGLYRILMTLTKGRITSRSFTVPEGFNAFQIAGLLQEKGMVRQDDFLNAVRDRKVLSEYGINQATAEGFLYPETYFIPYEYTANDIVRLMIKSFFKKITPVYISRLKEKYGSLEKGVNLASLVEWEAKADFERSIIAGVFLNRLRGNLNLGSCATVLYALNRHKERLLFKDLKVNSPYNTYMYQGLPPTPICNPSERSILAVIYPARDTYLYFVSMNNGRHYFSSTYNEHLQAYRYYILGER